MRNKAGKKGVSFLGAMAVGIATGLFTNFLYAYITSAL
jgi:hypothetical protein